MSRGGRGGWGKQKMGGVELPWDYDPDLKIEYQPSEQFPALERPAAAKPPRKLERKQVTKYRQIRDRIHEGPFYTVLGNHVRVGKRMAPAKAAIPIDTFGGMPSYAQKYMKQRRRIPRLDNRPYVLRLFPEELLSTLEPTHNTTISNDPTLKVKKKTLQLARSNQLSRLEIAEGESSRRDNAEDADDDDDDLERDVNDDEDAPEEDRDDDFVEDEEDMENDNDYNAEQYFDNGDDDVGDDGFDGGGGGEDYF